MAVSRSDVLLGAVVALSVLPRNHGDRTPAGNVDTRKGLGTGLGVRPGTAADRLNGIALPQRGSECRNKVWYRSRFFGPVSGLIRPPPFSYVRLVHPITEGNLERQRWRRRLHWITTTGHKSKDHYWPRIITGGSRFLRHLFAGLKSNCILRSPAFAASYTVSPDDEWLGRQTDAVAGRPPDERCRPLDL